MRSEGIIYLIFFFLLQENESPTGEINGCFVFTKTHVTKTINDLESTFVSDVKIRKIKELVDANPNGHNDIDNDVVAQNKSIQSDIQLLETQVGILVEKCTSSSSSNQVKSYKAI
ncbi:hypothetical protein MKX01_010031 [Papaver californicum]|nr:hypothetical protein MKX01_010031 [Papaver californicum]